jgi:hypothetical protein
MQEGKYFAKEDTEDIFLSLLRAEPVGFSWSLELFQENQSPKQKYIATDKI